MNSHTIKNEAQTIALAKDIAAKVTAPCFIALSGDLGAGKSFLARAIIREIMDDQAQEVPSPTFTLVQQYESDTAMIYHFDLYRLDKDRDVIELGWDDALFDGICLVEWPERAQALLPQDRIDVEFRITGANTREIKITAHGSAAQYGL